MPNRASVHSDLEKASGQRWERWLCTLSQFVAKDKFGSVDPSKPEEPKGLSDSHALAYIVFVQNMDGTV